MGNYNDAIGTFADPKPLKHISSVNDLFTFITNVLLQNSLLSRRQSDISDSYDSSTSINLQKLSVIHDQARKIIAMLHKANCPLTHTNDAVSISDHLKNANSTQVSQSQAAQPKPEDKKPQNTESLQVSHYNSGQSSQSKATLQKNGEVLGAEKRVKLNSLSDVNKTEQPSVSNQTIVSEKYQDVEVQQKPEQHKSNPNIVNQNGVEPPKRPSGRLNPQTHIQKDTQTTELSREGEIHRSAGFEEGPHDQPSKLANDGTEAVSNNQQVNGKIFKARDSDKKLSSVGAGDNNLSYAGDGNKASGDKLESISARIEELKAGLSEVKKTTDEMLDSQNKKVDTSLWFYCSVFLAVCLVGAVSGCFILYKDGK